ncbi:hypothetical protein CPB86DRAFT_47632 [Serendipita vermifera]|nr:hypothetical protein CPB86DRAFT_47632 [Serendipita vermifera]
MERGKMGHRIRNRSNSVVVDTSALQVECLPQSVASGPMDLAFIHRLPPEILTAVLLLVAKDQMPPYWYRSTVLGSVCRRWREVLNNAKSLWNNILIFAPDQVIYSL